MINGLQNFTRPPFGGGLSLKKFCFLGELFLPERLCIFFFQVGGGVSCLCTEIIDVAIQIKGL